MLSEKELQEKLRKIHAIYTQATTSGEREAAAAARDRLSGSVTAPAEKAVAIKCHLQDPWMTSLFLALARKHGLTPYRRWGQHRNTVMVDVQDSVLKRALWPEYIALRDELTAYLREATERIIREAVHHDTSDAAVRGSLSHTEE
jgi:hypothetical protein